MSAFSQDNGRTADASSDLLYNEDNWQDKPEAPEGASQIWGGNSLAGSQCQRWLGLFTVFGRDAVQAPGLAVRWSPPVGEGARAGTWPAPTGI